MPDKLWKPMLAAKPDPEEIDAVLASLPHGALWSPKLDGIRATVQNGRLYSRKLLLIPNLDLQALWGRKELNGLDGEIVVGDPRKEGCFNRSSSVVMSKSKCATEARFHVFDSYDEEEPFEIRHANASLIMDQSGLVNLTGNVSTTERHMALVPHTLIKTAGQLAAYEKKMTEAGYEGIMRRDPAGGYKQGRSTVRERGLIAVKRVVDAEAVIVDTYEQERNENEAKTGELGQTKRSQHKAGKVGKGTLGGFTVCMLEPTPKTVHGVRLAKLVTPGPRFNIGTGVGLGDEMRAELWAKRDELPGKIVKFRYQKVGTKDSPRQPIFLGFRDGRDM